MPAFALRPPLCHNSPMIIFLILALGSLALAGLTYYLMGLYTAWWWFWTIPAFWLLYALAGFAAFMILLYLISLCIARDKDKIYPPSRPAQWMVRQTAFVILKFMRVRVHVSGLGKLPGRGVAYAIVHNHLSMFDEFVLAAVLPSNLVFISKPSNLRIPVAGAFMRKAGYLPIIQGDIANGTKIIGLGSELLKKGERVCIAPEGTRNKDFPDPIMLPFHPGSFHLATDVEAPIAVFAIQNTGAIAKRFPSPTHVYLDCVGIIEPEEAKTMSSKELASYAEGLIKTRLEKKMARFYHLKKKDDQEG